MSFFDTTPLAPPDAIFNITASYKADPHPDKVNLGVGAYRTDEGKPWILPVVKKAKQLIVNDPNADHEYLPITGLPAFKAAAAKLILGESSPAIVENRVVSCQSISGTGANFIGALYLAKWYRPNGVCLVSKPTWGNHHQIFSIAGFQVQEYKYWDAQTLGLDLVGMLASLKAAPDGSVVVLHACAHNPTGVDPTQEQWKQIADVMEEKGHFPFFDCAYQGFATGDLDKDAFAVRYFESRGFEFLVCQSFAKNFGIYSERCGCLNIVAKTPELAKCVESQVAKLVRSTYSNPPAFGARIVATVLNNPALYEEWRENLAYMSGRIIAMRKALKEYLDELNTPGTWDHIVNQIGMFSFTGLNANQVKVLTEKYHVYLTSNGRISMAGLNTGNVRYFALAVDDVVRHHANE